MVSNETRQNCPALARAMAWLSSALVELCHSTSGTLLLDSFFRAGEDRIKSQSMDVSQLSPTRQDEDDLPHEMVKYSFLE